MHDSMPEAAAVVGWVGLNYPDVMQNHPTVEAARASNFTKQALLRFAQKLKEFFGLIGHSF